MVLDTPAKRPARFDLAAYWKRSAEEYRKQRRYVATLRVERRAADTLSMWCRVLPTATDDARSDGQSVTLDIDFDDEDQAFFIVLGFGARVEVLEPTRLRQRVAAEIAGMFKRLGARAIVRTTPR